MDTTKKNPQRLWLGRTKILEGSGRGETMEQNGFETDFDAKVIPYKPVALPGNGFYHPSYSTTVRTILE